MQIDKIFFTQLAHGRLPAAQKIRSAGDGHVGRLDRVKTGAESDAAAHIVRRHDGTGDTVPLRETRPAGRFSLSPQPEAMDRLQTVFQPLIVHRMIAHNDQRGIHQLAQHVRAVPCRQALADRASRSLARIETDRAELAADPDHQMPGPAARIKLDRFRAKLFVDGFQQVAGFFTLQALGLAFHRHGRRQLLDISVGVLAGRRAAQRDHAAPVDDIVLADRHAQARGLQRTRSRIELARVVPEHRRLDHPAGNGRSVDGHHRNAHLSLTRHRIHIGRGSRLER